MTICFKWIKVYWALVCVAIFSAFCTVRAQNTAEPAPVFVGFIKSSSSGALFRIQWTDATGATLQSWRRVGDDVGSFQIVGFDEPAAALSLKHISGRVYRIFLPDGIVAARLTEEEFKTLQSFLPGQQNARKEAPVLTREKTRAFWLRILEENAVPPIPGLVLDFSGSSLPPDKREEFQQGQAHAARNFSRLLFLVPKNDGTVHYSWIWINHFDIPEEMTRNLLESDWDELSKLSAGWRMRTVGGCCRAGSSLTLRSPLPHHE